VAVFGNGGGAPAYGPAGGDPYGDDPSQGYGGRQQSGRWIRRGRKIVLLGV
jgi:hypothetical protein